MGQLSWCAGPARSTWEGRSRPTMPSASAAAAIIASRSMPVATPMSSTMCTSSSVAMLPVAPGAYGQPPRPPTEASKSATPSSSAASTLASPVPRVLWKCRFSPVSGWAERNAPTSARTRVGVAIPVVSPNEAESAPSAMARPATDTTRLHRHVALVRAAPRGGHDHLHGGAAVVRDRDDLGDLVQRLARATG